MCRRVVDNVAVQLTHFDELTRPHGLRTPDESIWREKKVSITEIMYMDGYYSNET